ncbi:hypothetical protein [Rhizobium sp. 18055]|uniref:hypothetical protein n=1 Tax=Rhizobium sp. 18055 TaxID=2681403 RepID=UPI001AEF24BA|nr:hypothetical protein [Rhizobium sp. 18055]
MTMLIRHFRRLRHNSRSGFPGRATSGGPGRSIRASDVILLMLAALLVAAAAYKLISG